MFYYYDKNELKFKPSKKAYTTFISACVISLVSIIFAIITLLSSGEKDPNLVDLRNLEPEERIIILNDADEFSEEKLKDYLLELNVKFPDIVMAQARYESGNWGTNPGARIFESNDNLFGMKEATSRATTCRGLQFEHAFYDHWRMSVVDYALWQNAYARKIKTREEYFAYLRNVYAQGSYEAIEQITKEVRTKYPELCVVNFPRLEK
ncbi:MAG: glucosaminidase domain-containing protein [Nanoarchaeota archaeon]